MLASMLSRQQFYLNTFQKDNVFTSEIKSLLPLTTLQQIIKIESNVCKQCQHKSDLY